MPHFDRRLLEDPAEAEGREALRAVLGPASRPPKVADRFGAPTSPEPRTVGRGPRPRPRPGLATVA